MKKKNSFNYFISILYFKLFINDFTFLLENKKSS